MKNSLKHLAAALLAALVLSLTTASANHHAAPAGKLRHVVCLKFVEGTTDAQIKELVAEVYAFPRTIPEMKAVEGGTNVSKEGHDKGFTHCFTMTFDDVKGLEVYLPHPEHVRVVEKFKHLFADVFVFDYLTK